MAYKQLGNFQEAIKYQQKYLVIAKELGDKEGERKAYCNLGNAHHGLNHFQLAIEYHMKSLSIAQEAGSMASEAATFFNLGNAYKDLGNFPRALEYYGRYMYLAEELNDQAGLERIYIILGNVYFFLGNFPEAIFNYSRDLAIALETRDRARQEMAYSNIGRAHFHLGDVQESIKYHKKALTIATELGDEDAKGQSCCNLGVAYKSLGQFEEAIGYYKEDLTIRKEIGDTVGEAEAYQALGDTCEDLGNFQEALDNFQSAAKALDIARASLQPEDVWKTHFHNLYRDVYSGMCGNLLNLEKVEEALSVAEQARVQQLIDDWKMQYGINVPLPLLELKERIPCASTDSSTQIVFLELNKKKLNFWVISSGNKITFRQRELGDQNAKHSLSVLLRSTLKKIRAHITSGYESRSLQELCDDDDEEEEAVNRDDNGYDRDSNHDDNDDDDDDDDGEKTQSESSTCTVESLQPLYDAVIQPIADLLYADKLIIVPDGPLCAAPLAALSKSIRICTVPSLISLKVIRDLPNDYHSKDGALLVGDPCLQKLAKKGKPAYTQLPSAICQKGSGDDRRNS